MYINIHVPSFHIRLYSVPEVEFEFLAPARLICRADLPGGGVDVDIILGQKVIFLISKDRPSPRGILP